MHLIVGFDLVASDWVAPYGKGTNADFLFKVTQHVVSDREFSSSLELKFSETGDGIQQLDPKSDIHSLLRSPQVAPLVGYVPNLVLSDSQKPAADVSSEYHTSQESDNYIFRVRTVRRSDGTILGACYGKIYGPIQYSISGRKYLGPNQPGNSVIFSYYLNPDENSRSLEFDLKRNLFKRLDSFDNPADP